MSDIPYLKLRKFLDQFPLGFPQTHSRVEIKILKRLFTQEEARIAVLLTPFPEDADQIAERTGLDKKELKEKLDRGEKFFLLNPLSDIEFSEGHIPGSVNIPMQRIMDTDLLLPDRNTLIVTYCLGPK